MKTTFMIRVIPMALLFLGAGHLTSRADSAIWNSNSSGNWSNGALWSPASAPGSTVSITSTDGAVFDTSTGVTVTIDQTNQNIGSMLFTGNSTEAFTISGKPLLLSSGGSIKGSIGAQRTETFSSALILEPVNSTSNGSYTFTTGIGALNQFTFNGGISGGTTTGSITLNLGTDSFPSTIHGTISNGNATGGVAVSQGGGGSWILSGSNTYTGATTVNGALTLTGSLNSGTQLILNNAIFTFTPASVFTQTVNGLALGPGISTIGTNNTSYTLNLGAITRSVGGIFNDTAPSGSLHTTTANTNGILGPWAVSNSFYTTNSGGALNFYNGATTGTIGTLANMTSATTNYAYSSATNITLTGDITGNTLAASGITIDNAGHSITLNGILNNFASSNPLNFIGNGNLIIGANNELDIITGIATNTIASPITGSGSLVFGSTNTSFAGSLTLSGNNSYSGGTVLNHGKLILTGSGSLGAATGGLTFYGGQLDLGGTSPTIGNVVGNNGTIYNSVVSTASTLTVGSGDATGGSLPFIEDNLGTGGTVALIKIGAGTLTLGAANSYTGGVTIANGALAITSASTVGSAQALGENATVTFTGASSTTPGTLQYTGTTGTLAQNLTIPSGDYGMIANTGGGVLTLSGTLSKNGSVLTLAGGQFVVTGSIIGSSANSDLNLGNTTYPGGATVGLTTVNSYNGPTIIDQASTLLTGVSGALPSTPPTDLSFGGVAPLNQANTLDLLGTSQTVSSLSDSTLSGSARQVISSNGTASGTPAIGSDASTSTGNLTVNYSGASPDSFGGSLGGSHNLTNFSLTKTGSGTLILTGNNTLTGGTTISAGTLEIGGNFGSLEGTIIDNAALVYDFGHSGIHLATNTISGTGTLIQTGDTLIFTGTATHTGGTTISGGSLQIGNNGTIGSIAGNIVDNANLAFDRSDSITFAGNISGSGSLTKYSTGTVILTGTNTYNGTTLTFSVNGTNYAGTTLIAGGTLQIGNGGTAGSLVGDVVDGLPTLAPASLVFDRSDTLTYGGAITGAGSVSQIGGGTLILTGNSTYTGPTIVTNGILIISSNLTSTSSFSTSTGATLNLASGNFSTSGTVTNNGTLVLGNGVTLNSTGIFTNNGTLDLTNDSTFTPPASFVNNGTILPYVPASDTPTMPTWAFIVLAALLLHRARKHLALREAL